jgi:hypothetical protein
MFDVQKIRMVRCSALKRKEVTTKEGLILSSENFELRTSNFEPPLVLYLDMQDLAIFAFYNIIPSTVPLEVPRP